MRNKEQLLSCPLCGGKAVLQTVEPHIHILKHAIPDCIGEAFIECTDCGCGIIKDTEWEAIQLWNKRKGQQSNDWIPCEDRLPEINHFYNVTIFDGEDYRVEPAYYARISLVNQKNMESSWYTDCTSNAELIEDEECKVIAWQPLLEPYKAE